MRISTVGTGRPCGEQLGARGGSVERSVCFTRAAVPSGTSVMPHAWRSSTPSFSKRSISGAGTAEPAQITRSSGASVRPLLSASAATPFHRVGTPAENVIPSASIAASTSAGCRFGPGSTSFAPTIAPTYGMHQPAAWKSGTATRIESRSPSPKPSTVAIRIEACASARWL